MSLVSYASSDDSDCENEIEPIKLNAVKMELQPTASDNPINEDEPEPEEIELKELKKPQAVALLLPKPKHVESQEQELDFAANFAKLPMPKSVIEQIVEEDDEFLRKKAMPLSYKSIEKPQPLPRTSKGPVKITIPSLRDFSDVDKDLDYIKTKNSTSSAHSKPTKGSSLLSILPKLKSEQNFGSTTDQNSIKSLATSRKSAAPAFIPDTVKNRRPAHNTEIIDGNRPTPRKTKNVPSSSDKAKAVALADCSDSEEDEKDDAFGDDFFALNAAAEQLPEVSASEINAMVAKRAAKMAAAKEKYLSVDAANKTESMQQDYEADTSDEFVRLAQKRYHDQQLNAEAMQALIGSSAKRRRGGQQRQQQSEIQVMDISSDEVLPNRDEWMRTALASSTSYQPTGVLTDEEPAAGTRRKHQITYLAHKAKSNEAELQAMWAANRQNRRATQSKYGF